MHLVFSLVVQCICGIQISHFTSIDIKRSNAPSVHIVCLMSWTVHEVCNTFWFMNPMSLEAKTPLFPVASDSINTPYPSDFHLCIFCNLVLLHRRGRLCLCHSRHFLSCLWQLIHWRCSGCYSGSFSCSLRAEPLTPPNP